jgi:pyridoxal biosynthesis lyase PdxS
MPQSCGTGKVARTFSGGDEKAALRMGFRAGAVAVMAAQGVGHIVKSVCPFRLDVEFRDESEPLSTDAAMHFGTMFTALT